MDQMEQTGGQPEQRHTSHSQLFIAVAFFIAGALIALAVDRSITANVDYVMCTRVIEENSTCGNGSWSDWSTVSSNDDVAACRLTTTEQRTYTGTRALRHTLQYQSRGNCDSSGGGEGGSSGLGSGTVVSQYTACQIQETRTSVTVSAAQSCSDVVVAPTTDTTVDASDVTGPGAITTSFNSLSGNQILQFRADLIDAQIDANPKLVAPGDTSVVTWNGVEVTACTVTGTNGDSWTGTSGERTSSPITELVTYNLTCTAFNGTQVTDSVSVGIIPNWEEQ